MRVNQSEHVTLSEEEKKRISLKEELFLSAEFHTVVNWMESRGWLEEKEDTM